MAFGDYLDRIFDPVLNTYNGSDTTNLVSPTNVIDKPKLVEAGRNLGRIFARKEVNPDEQDAKIFAQAFLAEIANAIKANPDSVIVENPLDRAQDFLFWLERSAQMLNNETRSNAYKQYKDFAEKQKNAIIAATGEDEKKLLINELLETEESFRKFSTGEKIGPSDPNKPIEREVLYPHYSSQTLKELIQTEDFETAEYFIEQSQRHDLPLTFSSEKGAGLFVFKDNSTFHFMGQVNLVKLAEQALIEPNSELSVFVKKQVIERMNYESVQDFIDEKLRSRE